MAELRTDWLTGRSVIIAENRALRPNEFAPEPTTGVQSTANLALAEAGLSEAAGVPNCPFCLGNESKTPPPVYEKRDQRGRWQVRVVPNMFPVVTSEAASAHSSSPAARREDSQEDKSDLSAPANGAHEVIIESARHMDRMSALSAEELRLVLDTYADRLGFWRADGRYRYGLVFKNQGPRAGASIAHLHSQFIAFGGTPPAVEAELRRAEDEYRRHSSCAYCGLIERERALGERVVLDREGFVALCPFASLQPHEVWLLPASHEPRFGENQAADTADRLANVLHALVVRLERKVPDGAFNLLLRTAPWRPECDTWFHWRIELIPRVNALAGFEFATGIHINPLAPEAAARQLRPA